MASITLQTLEELNTMNRGALVALLRFYLCVEADIPIKFRAILLGDVEYAYYEVPRTFSDKVAHFFGAIYRAVMPKMDRHLFMIEKPEGGYIISSSAKIALSLYIKKNLPLPTEVMMTYEQWLNSDEYKRRHGKWGDWF
tara:strand:+ start:179540 stop:179956 length:417 start_codon:yes stop_codon:yes gene_type:complete